MSESRRGSGPSVRAVTSPNFRRATIKVQHAVFSRQLGGESFDAGVVWMVRQQTMKPVPYFSHGDGGDEKVRGVLRVQPLEQSGIRVRLSRFTDRVGIQYEVHSRPGVTRSSGIFGGCQSVVPRTESCHAFNFAIER